MTIINHEIEISCELCKVKFHSAKILVELGVTSSILVTPHECEEKEEDEFDDFESEDLSISQ
jgi:hypothetical protein